MESQLETDAGRVDPAPLHLPTGIKILINAALSGLWLWLYYPVFSYLAVLFTREEFRTNQIVLLAVAALLILRFRKTRLKIHLDTSPRLHLPALALALGSSLVYLLGERYLDINTLSAVCFGLATYGMAGLWLSPPRWKAGFPVLFLLVGILPFGEHIETFIGYPVRILTANIVSRGLAVAGFPSVSLDTILVFESGISQVDIPCSGVKSLWTGMLFLLAATWIEDRPINLRWLLLAAGMGILLLAANLARVFVLVMVGPVAGWDLLARMIHVPLGVLGFAACCLIGLALLRALPAARQTVSPAETSISRPAWLGPALLGCVLIFTLLYQPRPPDATEPAAMAWQFPTGMQVQADPLTPQERGWITQGGAERAERFRFSSQAGSGSIMLITSQTWRGQHRPERCFEVYGLTIEQSATVLVTPDYPVKRLVLKDGTSPELIQAAYWLQAPGLTTEDYGTRIWADLGAQRASWVLVTIAFDAGQSPAPADMDALLVSIHTAVALQLQTGDQP